MGYWLGLGCGSKLKIEYPNDWFMMTWIDNSFLKSPGSSIMTNTISAARDLSELVNGYIRLMGILILWSTLQKTDQWNGRWKAFVLATMKTSKYHTLWKKTDELCCIKHRHGQFGCVWPVQTQKRFHRCRVPPGSREITSRVQKVHQQDNRSKDFIQILDIAWYIYIYIYI